MSKEKGQGLPLALRGEFTEVEGGVGFWEGDFCIDIDEMEIEFVGQTPRLTGRIEINLEAPGEDLLPDLPNV